jgi:hypothetical protein
MKLLNPAVGHCSGLGLARRMRKLIWRTLFGFFAQLVIAGGTSNAEVPKDFKCLKEEHWTWFGPKSWAAAEGASDLWVRLSTGKQHWRYGASGALCVNLCGLPFWPASCLLYASATGHGR